MGSSASWEDGAIFVRTIVSMKIIGMVTLTRQVIAELNIPSASYSAINKFYDATIKNIFFQKSCHHFEIFLIVGKIRYLTFKLFVHLSSFSLTVVDYS